MPERIPLFPLGTVLYPGLVLPLHIFEDRYRMLLARLLEEPDEDERFFGVVAIRLGRESGIDGVTSLHDVGCSAALRAVEPYDDGRSDVVTAGERRFRLLSVDTSEPYLQGDVEWLDEPIGDAAPVLARSVAARYLDYREVLGAHSDDPLPTDPAVLSYLVAATMVLDLADQQALLAADDASSRLRLELDLLRRESALLRQLPSLPGIEFARQPAPPN